MQRKPQGERKLASNWEGAYWIIQKLGKGTYRIVALEEQEFPRPWNAFLLGKYYN